MSTNWIKIAQNTNMPTRIGCYQITQNIFHHQLRPAIGIRWPTNWALLGDRHFSRVAIHRSRRTEHDIKYTRIGHCLQQHLTTVNVVVVITQWLRHAFTNRLQSGKMYDGIDRVPDKYLRQQIGIANIALNKLNRFTGNSLYTL